MMEKNIFLAKLAPLDEHGIYKHVSTLFLIILAKYNAYIQLYIYFHSSLAPFICDR